MSHSYDVIIVGGGIGGASLSYLLSGYGISNAVIERHPLPRYKACGGGLTPAARALLPLDIRGVIEEECYRAALEFKTRVLAVKSSDGPVISMVMRERLDLFVLQESCARGARLYERCHFMEMKGRPGDLLVFGDKGSFRCKYLIGADGAQSRVARKAGLSPPEPWVWALQSEVYPTNPKTMERFFGTARFDIGFQGSGYSWAFPKRDHLSVGTGAVFERPSLLKMILWRYLKALDLGDFHIKRLKLHAVPFRRNWEIRRDLPVILLGDAFGISDPISGEGMRFAIGSAVLASRALIDLFDHPSEVTGSYLESLKRVYHEDLLCAYEIARNFYSKPWLLKFLAILFGRAFVSRYYEVVSGGMRYKVFKEKFPLKILLKREADHEGPGG